VDEELAIALRGREARRRDSDDAGAIARELLGDGDDRGGPRARIADDSAFSTAARPASNCGFTRATTAPPWRDVGRSAAAQAAAR